MITTTWQGADALSRIRALAARQHGIVTRAQLIAAGVSPASVDRRLASAWLQRMHRGVYAVGPVLAPRAKEMAALLASGEGAVLSHRTVAVLWELQPPARAGVQVDVIITGRRRPRRPGLRLHRCRSLSPKEVTRIAGMRVTTPARTLLDLASLDIGARELEQALALALHRGLTKRTHIERLLARHRGRRGSRRLRELLNRGDEPAMTRSAAEERLLHLVRKAQLPVPRTNVKVRGHEVDFYWKRERLIVEMDGFAFHSSPEMFESDRRRDALLTASGMRVIRLTWSQLVAEPEVVIARLGALTWDQSRG